jgi:ribosomal protein S18 acetylase RimI-like enzyme
VLEIRRYHESDEAAVRRVCLLTGDNGGDATALYPDADLLSDIFAIPYTVIDPELCFVAVDTEADKPAGRVVGYIVGTVDSRRYVERYLEEWLPRVRDRHQEPPQEPDRVNDPQGAVTWRLHHPEFDPRVVGDYPAHLHINLLPEAQGKGGGRALMETFLNAAREHGAEAVHLNVSLTNTNARAFYAHVGFEPLVLPGNEAYAGGLVVRSTTVVTPPASAAGI